MERIKRNERMAALTKWLTDSPNQIFTLSQFCERFGSAKSTMSEDIDILRQVFETFELGRLETVTVIHGKGTGAVRKAVRDHLKRSRYVKSFRPGRYGEGENGVTIAEFK